jgi:hypothetical protein
MVEEMEMTLVRPARSTITPGPAPEFGGYTGSLHRRIVIFSVLAGLMGVLAVAVMTRPGLEVTSDSTVYIASARNLLAGNDLMSRGEPMTHFPLGYPCLLAASGLVTGDPYVGAAFWNALCYGLTIMLIGLIAGAASGGSWLAVAGAMAMTACSAVVLRRQLSACSESVSYACLFALAWRLRHYIGRPSALNLILISALAGAALTFRYAAAGFFPPVLFVILFMTGNERARKVKHALVFMAISCLPLGLWLVHNRLAHGNAAHRPVALHAVTAGDAATFAVNISRFLFPGTGSMVRAGLLLMAAVWVVGRLRQIGGKNRVAGEPRRWPACLMLLAAEYLLLLVIAKSFFDASITFEERIASPFFLLIVLAGLPVLFRKSLAPSDKRLGMIYAGAALIVVATGLNVRDFVRGEAASANPLGYAGAAWKASDGIRLAAGAPAAVTVYSNMPDAIEFLTTRPARMLPERYSPLSSLANQDLEQDLRLVRTQLLEHKAIAIYFDAERQRPYLVTEKDILQAWQGVPCVELKGARAYGLSADGSASGAGAT